MDVQNHKGNTPPDSESKNSSALSVWRLILDTNSSKIDKLNTEHTHTYSHKIINNSTLQRTTINTT
jgi:hypothetical protein